MISLLLRISSAGSGWKYQINDWFPRKVIIFLWFVSTFTKVKMVSRISSLLILKNRWLWPTSGNGNEGIGYCLLIKKTGSFIIIFYHNWRHLLQKFFKNSDEKNSQNSRQEKTRWLWNFVIRNSERILLLFGSLTKLKRLENLKHIKNSHKNSWKISTGETRGIW